jgi:hypothetical protein
LAGVSAISSSLGRAPLAFLGLPSVHSIVDGIVNFFFQDVARALVPDFLKNASVSTIKWLVALPDPTTWAHVGQLEGDMSYLAASLLAVSFTASIVRYLLVGLTGSGSPLQALSSTVASAGMMVAYQWAAHQAVALVNTLTDSILSFPVVGAGLQRTVGVLFGSALLVGSGGVFLAVLVIVGVVFAAVMFALKVLLLIGVAFVYVSGLLAIAVRPLPELASLSRAWGSIVLTIALVPIGWTILFAVAAALSLDATSFGSAGGAGGLSSHVAGAFAALLTFYLAVKLPFAALSHLRGSFGGPSLSAGTTGAPGSGGSGGGFQRVSDAHARLRSNTLAAGRAAGLAASALGAPAGGPLGAAGRGASRHSAPLAASALAAGSAIGGAALASGGRLGQRLGAQRERRSGDDGERPEQARSRARATRERLGLARQTFTRVFAIHCAGERTRAGAKRGATPTRFATGPGSQPRPANVGRSGPAQPPRPPQRAAPAGEGNTRASSATARGGDSDGKAPSRHSVDGPNTRPRPTPGPATRGTASAREERLAADAPTQRRTSPSDKPKPPRVNGTLGGNASPSTRSGEPQRGGQSKASSQPPRARPSRQTASRGNNAPPPAPNTPRGPRTGGDASRRARRA